MQKILDKGFSGWFKAHEPCLRLFGMMSSHAELSRASADPLSYLLDQQQNNAEAINNLAGVWTPSAPSGQSSRQ